ncbi:peptide-methionine (S)-S-oxide reductase MsrA [Candidatus Kaiserbacteria bacterium]|nr:peptide-methionine (S)-S-oxide reductase MsrA [Candidatus Kaiserbacteria bacterium]
MNSVAVFGGGCFWCTEAVFKMLRGVISVEPGYAGGSTGSPQAAPTYYEVSSGTTGHAEVIKIEYDSSQVSFKNLLTVFFGSHDSTQVNRQGNDVGTQYRSIVLYSDETQKKEAEGFIKELNDSSKEGKPIATQVAPFTKFYPAEQEHLDYYARNKEQGYCQIIIAPKLQKVQEKFAELLKNQTEKP